MQDLLDQHHFGILTEVNRDLFEVALRTPSRPPLSLLIAAARQNGTINPKLQAEDIGAILATGLAAQAHLAPTPTEWP